MCQAIILRNKTDAEFHGKVAQKLNRFFFFLKNVQTLVQTLVKTPTCCFFFLTASICDLQQ